MERTCKKCGETKPIEEFRKGKNCRYGYLFTCEVCNKEHIKEWRQNNKEHVKEVNKEWYQNNKERLKEVSKEWYQNNKEYSLKRGKEYSQNNKEYFKKYHKKYHRNAINVISDPYIHGILRNQHGLSRQTLKQHPELIKKWRQQIIFKRSLKSLKNESITNS